MIETDLDDVRRLQDDLAKFSKKAWPYANRFALNGMAFEGRRQYLTEMREDLTLRNKWTEKGVRVEKAQGTDPRRQFSAVGHVDEYMAGQEFGDIRKGKGRTGKPIPTSRAAGQPRGAKRTKVPTRRNRMSQIRLNGKLVTPKTPKQRMILLARQAIETGRRHIYLDGTSGPREGMYYVKGGSLKNKRGWPKGARLDMVWDLSRPAIRIKRQPLLAPATDEVYKRGPAIYVDSLKQQIERQRLFRSRRK